MANTWPSGRNTEVLTQSVCDFQRYRTLPLWVSKIRTRWSSPTAAKSFPAGSSATLEITGVFSSESGGANSMTLTAERSGTASAGPAATPIQPTTKNTPHARGMDNFNIFATRN